MAQGSLSLSHPFPSVGICPQGSRCELDSPLSGFRGQRPWLALGSRQHITLRSQRVTSTIAQGGGGCTEVSEEGRPGCTQCFGGPCPGQGSQQGTVSNDWRQFSCHNAGTERPAGRG